MKVYMYRLTGENDSNIQPEVGLAVVDHLEHLFWILDQFGNPYDYQFCQARVGDALSVAIEFSGDDPDVNPNGNKYDLVSETDNKVNGIYMSEGVNEQDRKWLKFVYPHANLYKTQRI